MPLGKGLESGVYHFSNGLIYQVGTDSLGRLQRQTLALPAKKQTPTNERLFVGREFVPQTKVSDPFNVSSGLTQQQQPPQSFRKFSHAVTTDYAATWGLNRIVLDGIQNHLPDDSGGKTVFVEFFAEGRWRPFSDRTLFQDQSDQITAIRFGDDGQGFDDHALELFFSTKSNDQKSAGQFGEGLKLISAASLMHGLDMEITSRRWRAVPL